MRIVIAGGSGFVGQKLTELLLEEGYEVVILTRSEKKSSRNISYVKWLEEGSTRKTTLSLQMFSLTLPVCPLTTGDGRLSTKNKFTIAE